jgi:hypothetical protein
MHHRWTVVKTEYLSCGAMEASSRLAAIVLFVQQGKWGQDQAVSRMSTGNLRMRRLPKRQVW